MNQYLHQRIRELEWQRKAAIDWARRYRTKYPDGAHNNVRVARSVNHEIIRIKRALKAWGV